jgi:hypothetical protein
MKARTGRALRASKSSVRASRVRKSGVKKEALLNTLARGVGRAAGVIANAAQALSGETLAVVQKEALRKARRKPSARSLQKNRKTAKATSKP